MTPFKQDFMKEAILLLNNVTNRYTLKQSDDQALMIFALFLLDDIGQEKDKIMRFKNNIVTHNFTEGNGNITFWRKSEDGTHLIIGFLFSENELENALYITFDNLAHILDEWASVGDRMPPYVLFKREHERVVMEAPGRTDIKKYAPASESYTPPAFLSGGTAAVAKKSFLDRIRKRISTFFKK